MKANVGTDYSFGVTDPTAEDAGAGYVSTIRVLNDRVAELDSSQQRWKVGAFVGGLAAFGLGLVLGRRRK